MEVVDAQQLEVDGAMRQAVGAAAGQGRCGATQGNRERAEDGEKKGQRAVPATGNGHSTLLWVVPRMVAGVAVVAGRSVRTRLPTVRQSSLVG